MPIRAAGRYEPHLAAFIEQLRSHHYSRTMVDHAARVVPALFAALRRQGVRDVRAVNESHLTAFAAELARTKTARGALPAPATQNSYLLSVRRFFVFLERSGVILHNPALALPFRKIDSLPRHVLSERQAEELINTPLLTAVGVRDRAILELFYGTAIRLTECARLDVADVDLSQETMLVRSGKGKRDRLVPVPARAAAALGRYLADARPAMMHDPKEQALFLADRLGQRLGIGSIGKAVKAYGLAIGVNLTPHGLRHACATHLLRRGADIRHVQQLLGHRDIHITARYTGVAIKDLHDVFHLAHPREKGAKAKRRVRE